MRQKRKRHLRQFPGRKPYRFQTLLIAAGTCSIIVLAMLTIIPAVYAQTQGSGPQTLCSRGCPNSASCIHLRSLTSSDILAAAEQTPMYQHLLQNSQAIPSENKNHVHIDQLLKYSTLGTPVLVKPYREDAPLETYWVVPVLNRAKHPVMLLTFQYDATTQRLQASDFEGGNDFTNSHAFPAISQATAVALVERKEGQTVITQGSQAPTLVYLDFNPYANGLPANDFPWKGGGTAPIDPIWRVSTTGGHYYYVDHTGQQVYTGKQLPIAPSELPAL